VEFSLVTKVGINFEGNWRIRKKAIGSLLFGVWFKREQSQFFATLLSFSGADKTHKIVIAPLQVGLSLNTKGLF
jgi:hypothetical protein